MKVKTLYLLQRTQIDLTGKEDSFLDNSKVPKQAGSPFRIQEHKHRHTSSGVLNPLNFVLRFSCHVVFSRHAKPAS